MRIIRKQGVNTPFLAPKGERIYEMIGVLEEIGRTTKHSLGYVVIPQKIFVSALPQDIRRDVLYFEGLTKTDY